MACIGTDSRYTAIGVKPNFVVDETVSSGLALSTPSRTGWGMGMYDFDNDGSKDLFYAASHFPGAAAQVRSLVETPSLVLRNLANG
jgi:hypothetical protein